MTRKLSDSHFVNNQERMQEILQEQVRNMVFGRSSKASGRVYSEDANVERKLSVLKLIYATWLVEMQCSHQAAALRDSHKKI